MLKIVTTVGTSLLENFKDPGGPAFRNFYEKIEDKSASEYSHYEAEIKTFLPLMVKYISNDPSAASAEVKSCIKIREKYSETATVYLISSDTFASVLAAEAIDKYLNSLGGSEKKFLSVFIRDDKQHVIPSLQVEDKTAFETAGLPNLLSSLYYFLGEEEDKKNPDIKVINITGGFKGVIPYLTIFAQLKGFPINYSFEYTDSLIEIPALPIGFESAFAEKYGYMLFNRKSLHQEDKEELVKLGLMDGNNSPTALAALLTEYEVENLPTSINVLGLVIEYKLMEYYQNSPMTGFSNVERGNLFLAGANRENPPKGAEIDIVLKKSKQEIDQTPFIAVECKSAKMVQTKLNKVKEQLKKKLKLMKSSGVIPQEIHFMLYTFPGKRATINTVISNLEKHNLLELAQTVTDNLPGVKTRFFMARFDLHSAYANDNPYQSFINEKLELNKNFKEILIGEKNV